MPSLPDNESGMSGYLRFKPQWSAENESNVKLMGWVMRYGNTAKWQICFLFCGFFFYVYMDCVTDAFLPAKWIISFSATS